MAGGLRYKFQDTTISFLVDWNSDSPSDLISAVTKASPPVVTSTTHGRSDADVIRINSAVGMTELNAQAFVINVTGASTYELLGTDSTGYGTYTGGGRVDVGSFSALCELTGYNRQGGTSPDIPATSICSTAQEFEVGLPDPGSVQIDYNFAPSTNVQQAIETAYKNGTTMAIKIVLPKSGGTMVLLGTVQQTGESAQVNGIWTGSLTLRMTGQRYDFF